MRFFFVMMAMLAMTTAAIAADFKSPIPQLDGKPIPLSDTDKNPLTLGKVCSDALIAQLPGDTPSVDEKGERFRLALKIINRPQETLTANEVVLIKKVVGIAYGSLVVGRVNELLDPASVIPK